MRRRLLRSLLGSDWLAFAVVAVCLVAFPALAQEAAGAADAAGPPGWVQWATLAATALLGLVVTLGPTLAKMTKTTVDDDAIEWLRKNRTTVEEQIKTVARWKDPNDPSVPTGPKA